jgi:hypothetical protein
MKSTMARTTPTRRAALGSSILLAMLVWPGCARMSESIRKPSVGVNGGFEYTESGLPINWLVYSPSTIPTRKYELSFDKVDFQEGKQALKFIVDECSQTGGRHSPGITQEYPAEPGRSYKISFWIKNDGCDYVVSAGGVDAKTAQLNTVDLSQESTSKWKFVTHELNVPRQFRRIRFELSIRSSGSLWIDDVRIEPFNNGDGHADLSVIN